MLSHIAPNLTELSPVYIKEKLNSTRFAVFVTMTDTSRYLKGVKTRERARGTASPAAAALDILHCPLK